jgi:hypothetical protein
MLRRNGVADAYSKTAEYVAKILQAPKPATCQFSSRAIRSGDQPENRRRSGSRYGVVARPRRSDDRELRPSKEPHSIIGLKTCSRATAARISILKAYGAPGVATI